METNEAASFKKCRQVLAELGAEIEQKQKTGAYVTEGGFSIYEKDSNDLEKKYMDRKGLGAKVKCPDHANKSATCLNTYFRF